MVLKCLWSIPWIRSHQPVKLSSSNCTTELIKGQWRDQTKENQPRIVTWIFRVGWVGGNWEWRSRDASSKEQCVATNVQEAAGLWNNATNYIYAMPTQNLYHQWPLHIHHPSYAPNLCPLHLPCLDQWLNYIETKLEHFWSIHVQNTFTPSATCMTVLTPVNRLREKAIFWVSPA